MNFSLSEEDHEKIREWCHEQDSKWFYENEEFASQFDGTPANPYYGATGGVLTYCFTPTSLGVIVKVRHGATSEELDLTDYESW